MGFLRIRKNTFISLAIFGMVFLVIIVSQYKMGSSYVDSDMAAEMVLADQLNDEGVLLSNDWYYSTEIRIIGEPTLLALTERIFPNDWHSARVLAKAITMLVFSATFVYLSRVLGIGNYGVLGAAVLISPFGFWHAFHSVFGPFYMTHMIYVNVILALIIDIANRINVKKNLYYLLGIVAFIAGLGGVRILLMLIVPEMMTVGVMYLMKAQKEKRLSFDNDSWINRLIKSSLVAFASSVVGYVVNSKVIYKLYSIVNINQTWKDFSLSSFLEALSWFLELFGYPVNDFFDEPISIMSLKGVIFGGGGLMVALAVVIALYRLLKIQERLDEKRVFLLLLLIAILMIDGTVFALGDGVGGSNGSYWLPILSLPVLVVIIWIDSEQFVFKHTRKVVGGILLCIVFTISICMIKYFSYTSFRHPIGVEQVTDWLIENGYCNGYSTFWNGHIVEEISNGDIEIWVVNQLATLENTDNMLQSKKHDYTLPTGKIFILVRGDELESIIGISEISNKIVYQDINGFTVFGFDNIDDLDKYIDVN